MARFDPAGSGLTDDRGYIAARAEVRSLIIAPLIAAGTALGVLLVFRDVTEEPYDETDLQLCADLAERGAQAIYNARLMGRGGARRRGAGRGAGPAAARRADGEPGPAGRRHRARLQQPAERDRRLFRHGRGGDSGPGGRGRAAGQRARRRRAGPRRGAAGDKAHPPAADLRPQRRRAPRGAQPQRASSPAWSSCCAAPSASTSP